MTPVSSRAAAVLVAALTGPLAAAGEDRAAIQAAMKQAAAFMTETVAVRGGHVWAVSEDLERRWGEVPARPSQVWLQGGTEAVGQVLLDAWQATHDEDYLEAARKAADAVVYGQTPAGGWHYFIDFEPAGLDQWYADVASRFRYGYEEYRYYYGNATFDDQVTPAAAAFLLRFYNLTLDPAYRAPVLEALDFVLEAQYPNGLWPQRYPLRHDYAHDGLPDYTSYSTLNDGASQAAAELLLEAFATLGDPRYFDGARRAAEGLIAIQGPAGQAAWAEQYGPDLRPVAARTHEPAGYVVRESLGALELLARFWLMTGDERYLAPMPQAIDWFERINRASAEERFPIPRYWEPGSNRPVYVVRVDGRTPEGYGRYAWTTEPGETDCDGNPCRGDGAPAVDVAAVERQYEEIAALATPEARADYLEGWRLRREAAARVPRTVESVADIVAALDARGAWVTDDIPVNEPNFATGGDVQRTVTGISTRVFVDRLSALIATLATGDDTTTNRTTMDKEEQ
ncbi:MAG TPA: pectate lyase [Woeseiaceae bacterium]|nr:pectate lyase [Woeseiaceae bacterium]